MDGTLAVGDGGGHHHELVTADPGDKVLELHDAGEAVGDLSKKLIAGPVAEDIVDRLEAIEVDEHDGRLTPRAQESVEPIEQQASVRQPSEHIMVAEVLESPPRSVEVTDVVGGDHQSGHHWVGEEVDELEAQWT